METLDDRIARDGPVKELDAVGWAIRLAKRLEALHSLGVAHGSVSPACILTTGADRTSRAYIADVQLTTSSVAFQSPERLLGGDISPADDTWAVACTLYAALTGSSPFVGANDAETRQKILGGQPAPLAVFDVGDDDLQHILDSALTRELGQRTSTVTALRNALEEWHPDPGVGALSPLDDDDASEGDEDMRTVMRPAPAFLSAPTRKAAPAPPVPDEDDEDDEDQATQMREFKVPAGLIGSSPFGNGPPAPYAMSAAAVAARGPAPRPAAGRALDDPPPGFSAPAAFGAPAPAPFGASGFGAPGLRPGAKATLLGPGGPAAFGGGTAPMAPMGAAAPRNAVDEDDDDDEEGARTMMRTSPVDDSSHPSGLRVAHAPTPSGDDDDEEGARTMMREPSDASWGVPANHPVPPPAPSAPRHFGGAPLGPAPGWSSDPAPAKTLALAGFELPPEITPHPGSGSFPRMQDHGPPPGVSFGAQPGHFGQVDHPGPGAFPAMGAPAPYGGPIVAPFQAGPQPGPMAPMGNQGPNMAQLDAAAASANSRRIVVLTAAIALLIIAATTFVVLLLRGIK